MKSIIKAQIWCDYGTEWCAYGTGDIYKVLADNKGIIKKVINEELQYKVESVHLKITESNVAASKQKIWLTLEFFLKNEDELEDLLEKYTCFCSDDIFWNVLEYKLEEKTSATFGKRTVPSIRVFNPTDVDPADTSGDEVPARKVPSPNTKGYGTPTFRPQIPMAASNMAGMSRNIVKYHTYAGTRRIHEANPVGPADGESINSPRQHDSQLNKPLTTFMRMEWMMLDKNTGGRLFAPPTIVGSAVDRYCFAVSAENKMNTRSVHFYQTRRIKEKAKTYKSVAIDAKPLGDDMVLTKIYSGNSRLLGVSNYLLQKIQGVWNIAPKVFKRF